MKGEPHIQQEGFLIHLALVNPTGRALAQPAVWQTGVHFARPTNSTQNPYSTLGGSGEAARHASVVAPARSHPHHRHTCAQHTTSRRIITHGTVRRATEAFVQHSVVPARKLEEAVTATAAAAAGAAPWEPWRVWTLICTATQGFEVEGFGYSRGTEQRCHEGED